MSIRLITMTMLSTSLVIGGLEVMARYTSAAKEEVLAGKERLSAIVDEPLTSREHDNRFIKHNLYLLQSLEGRENYEVGLIGTSRTKALSASKFGHDYHFNGAGNSYNEMTYALLVEAEILYKFLPNLKKVYVEASMLLRRPGPSEFNVAEDHLKYLSILKEFTDLRREFPGEGFEDYLERKRGAGFNLALFENRDRYTVSGLLLDKGESEELGIEHSKVFTEINSYGESLGSFSYKNDKPIKSISVDSPKVKRIRNVGKYDSFDYLFEMIAVWGKRRGVEVVFFQPPVRSDMQHYQREYGLDHHNQALKEFAREYAVKVINMNHLKNGYGEDSGLFSDEDHMATCAGNAAVFSALMVGEDRLSAQGENYLEIPYEDVRKTAENLESRFCGV